MNFTKACKSFLTALLAVAITLSAAAFAQADVLHLKDGRQLEGTVESEGDGYVYFILKIGGIEKREIFLTEDIEKIVREDTDKLEEDAQDEDEEIYIPEGACKIAFITLGDPPMDMVGPFLNADALRRSKEILDELPEEQKPDIVVLKINSGGGALFEVWPLQEAIHEELKQDYRVVGWIESAISAASLTIFNCEEIYMMKEGNVGGTVAYSMGSGGAQAMEGEGLERVLDMGARISINGRINPLIMRAMQVWMTLSCDIDEDGNITWYDDDRGEHLVSPEDRILTLNSVDAVKYGVAKAIVDTKDEIAKALGCQEWVEVGYEADEYQHEFRENVRIAQARATELARKMQLALDFANNADEKMRTRQIGTARRYLRELKALVRKAPSLETYGAGGLPPLTDEWFREVDEQLRDAARG